MFSKTALSKWLNHPLVPKSAVCLLSGYTKAIFKKDLFAGMTVGIIALPLALAFAIASGVEPARGLYTAVIAGFLISLLGGSRIQIGGPTGAFVVIVYSVVERHGYEGLVLATLMAAVLLVGMGLCGLGRLIKYIPYPLIVGFTTGLALLIFVSQIRDFFGFSIAQMPADFIGKWTEYARHSASIDMTALSLGLCCLLGILAMRKWAPSLPWGISIIVLATVCCWLLGLHVETIGSRYGAIPHGLLTPSMPSFAWDLQRLQTLFPEAVAIAVLAGLESLLSAVIGDGMSGGRHKPDCELVAQGIANAASVLCGGMPATGAISRTAANVKTGAKTPVAGMIHACVLLIIMLAFGPLVVHIPLAALAAVLMVVAWNMAEVERFIHLFKAPRGDIAVMLTACALTIFVDLSFAVQMAMILALFLFMRRMSDKVPTLQPVSPDLDRNIPNGMEFYQLRGPLFFGVADKIMDLAHPMRPSPKLFLLDMQDVHVLDASGMYALQEVALKCKKQETHLLLSGVREEVHAALKQFGFFTWLSPESIFLNTEAALEYAHKILSEKELVDHSFSQQEVS